MTTLNKDTSDRVYRERFFSGIRFVKLIADELKREGFEVKTPDQRPKKIRKNYSDKGDIKILKDGEVRFTLEVKSRKLNFTSKYDYPHSNVIVENVGQFNAKKHKVAAYVIISQFTEEKFAIPMSSKKHWIIDKVYDSEKQVIIEKYLVHKIHTIEFQELIEKLKEKLK